MNPSDFVTQRLRLVTITTEMMDADAAHSPVLSKLLAATVPAEWPPEYWEPHVYDFMKRQDIEHPQTAGWNRYVLLRGTPPTLIGNMCAFPRTGSEAEIGYGILEPWQRLGLATEGARAFIAELFRDCGLQTITAQTFPNLTASLRVMEKCGFRFVGVGDEEGTVRYTLRR